MPWYNVTPHRIYEGSGYFKEWELDPQDPLARARAWIHAVNTYDFFEYCDVWFRNMEDGTAWNERPDTDWSTQEYPGKAPLTLERVDRIVEELDADFEIERNRFPEGRGPEFSRLTGEARIAFVQGLYKLGKSNAQIIEEAKMRLTAGETLPPPSDAQTEEVLTRKGHPKPVT